MASPPQRTDLDPGIIDAILGKPDSELMKEALARAQDASLDEGARLTALDDLEMVKLLQRSCLSIVLRLTSSLPSSRFSSSSRTSTMRMVMHATFPSGVDQTATDLTASLFQTTRS